MYSACRIASILLPIIFAGAGHADEPISLRGLTGVRVVVEAFAEDAVRDGLRKETVQTDVELKLRMAGIKVLSDKEYFAAEGKPYLYIQVNLLKTPSAGIYSVSALVALKQDVLLVRDLVAEVKATTWSAGSVSAIGAPRLREVREHIKALVDEFTKAWLSVNPGK